MNLDDYDFCSDDEYLEQWTSGYVIDSYWQNVELSELSYYDDNSYNNFEMCYKGFKITRTCQGDYIIYKIGRKHNHWLLDKENNEYERKYKAQKYQYHFNNKEGVIEKIKEEIDSLD